MSPPSPLPRVMLVVAIFSGLAFETGANGSSTSPPSLTNEMVTDITEFIEIFEDVTEITTLIGEETISTPKSQNKEEGPWKLVEARFTVHDKTTNDLGDALKNEIIMAINTIFNTFSTSNKYNTSAVDGFGVHGKHSVVANVQLAFSPGLTDEERSEEVMVLYEVVEKKHALSDSLRVDELYVKNETGSYVRMSDACSVTPCAEGMACNPDSNHCEEEEDDDDEEGDNGKPDLYVGIIAASAIAGIIVIAILLAACINFINKRRIRTGRPGELFGIDNVVALELNDEKIHISGMATQTDESFLLARSHKDGVPPKAGHAHRIMQTNESFLLTKSQLLKAHGGATARHRSSGSPIGVVSANARRLSGPSSCKSSEGEATPTTSSAGGNGITRKPSTKTERAPRPPNDHEATPTPASAELTSTEDPASRPDRQTTDNDPKLVQAVITDAVPKGGKASLEIQDEKSDVHELYQGRKILKV